MYTKEILDEIAADNCKDKLSITKTITPTEVPCNGVITVTLEITAKENLTNLSITDNLQNQYVDFASFTSTSIGTSTYIPNGEKISWVISSLTNGSTGTLIYTVIPTINALGKNARVNTNVIIKSDQVNCEFNPDSDNFTVVECNDVSSDCCCSTCKDITLPACSTLTADSITVENLACEGRFLVLNVDLKNICKGKKVAVAVLLYDKDSVTGKLTPIAFKVFSATAPNDNLPPSCTEFVITNICFALPDDNSLCTDRTLVAKVIANYVGFDEPSCTC